MVRCALRSGDPIADLVRWVFRDAAGSAAEAPAWCGTDTDAAAAAAALTHHRGWTLLARRAGAVPRLPSVLREEAARRRSAAVAQQMGIAADLHRCGAALDDAGIAWACLKGPALQAVYQRSGEERAYADLDLLVAPDRFADALRALSADGGALVDRNFTLMRERVPGEVTVRAPGGTMVDLHWSLLNKRERRDVLGVPTGALLGSAVRADLAGVPVPVLPPEEAVAHLCLHAAGSGATKLVWLLDITLAHRHTTPDPARLRLVARSWGIDRVVGLVLERVRHHLDPGLREGAAGLLSPGGWGAGERVARLVSSLERPDAAYAHAQLAIGAVEHRSLPAFIARRLSRIHSAGVANPFVQHPSDPGSALHAAGTPADLSAYLDAVRRQAA